MSIKLSNPRGTADILPDEIPSWQALESAARQLLVSYGYREIRTPIFEESVLFKRSLGETAEVVNKQLLEVKSQRSESDEASFALRPEGTAPVVRAYNQYNFGREAFLSKFFYIAPMFRGERPQKGRLRQFHQIGAEAIGRGADHPLLDVEMIALAVNFLKSLGLGGFKLKINSLGTAEDKAGFAQWLRAELKDKIGALSDECKNQYERNVFRLLDSKDKDCQAVVRSLQIGTAHLSTKGLEYFDAVRRGLDSLGIAYEVSSSLVRGLDYYTHTVFEISCEGLGAQDAIGAGGRYNGLIEQLGGGDRRSDGPVGAIGFALGIERMLLALEAQGKLPKVKAHLDAFVVAGNASLEGEAFSLLQKIRAAGISADMDFGGGRAFKKQFDQADKLGARFAVIVGEDEVKKGIVSIKDMKSGEQVAVSLGDVIAELKKKSGA
ncbi:MAG: histidine--tRNA ligase [Candidatus Omnitrophica bacterium]|nr:histidine--tRNA ligase [Candidatus Omnitrophota bacterium]